jgi:hypothetical protein
MRAVRSGVFSAVRAETVGRRSLQADSRLRVSVVRSEKMVAEAEDSSGTQRKGNVSRW